MPDNLIIAPDGLVKVEPARCTFCGRVALFDDLPQPRCKYCDRAYQAGVQAEREDHAASVRAGLMSIPTARA